MGNNVEAGLVNSRKNMQSSRISIKNTRNIPKRGIAIRNFTNLDSQAGTSTRKSLITDYLIPTNISDNAQISRSTSLNYRLSGQSKTLKAEMFCLERNSSINFIPKSFKNHSCTDVPCLIIFICFLFAWVYIASYALSKGNLNNVLIPTDSKNAKCGLDSGVRDKKKLFFFNLDKCLDPLTPITGCNTKQICVESCPQTSFIWQENKVEQGTSLNALKDKLICDSDINKTKLTNLGDIEKAIADNLCSGWYLKSSSLLNHCVWDFTDNICNMLPKILSGRKSRSDIHPSSFIGIEPLRFKFAQFFERIKSMCSKSNKQSMDKALKEKFVISNSNFNRVIAAIISHINCDDKNILAEQITTDLQNSWKIIILAIVIHLLAVLLFITLLRWLAALLVWTSICGVILSLSLSSIYSFQQYRLWSTEAHVPYHANHLMAKFQNILQNEDIWLYISILLGTLLIIILLIVFAIRKRIKIAIAIIKEASKAITNIKSSILFPIFPGILYIIVAILAAVILLYLSSIGEFSFIIVRRINNSTNTPVPEKCTCSGPKPKPYQLGDACIPELFEKICHIEDDVSKPCLQTSCSFNEIVKSRKIKWFILLNIFGFFWVTFFISAYEDMVLACTFSIWYWTSNKKTIPKLPLLKAVWLTTIYHLGTLAFGSLVLSICRVIRYILEIIERKAKLYNNALTRTVLCCMKCLFWLLQNFLRFLNRNAYIACAIYSTSFCKSSKKAFILITQNILRVYAVDRVSELLFFLSKLLVSTCTVFTTYMFLVTHPKAIPVYYPSVPVSLVAVIAYIISHFIFNTYSMAVDTIFFCFLEDSSENDGSAENPFYMSKELRKLLRKSQTRRS